MLRSLIPILLLALISIQCSKKKGNTIPSIIPQPQNVIWGDGEFELNQNTIIRFQGIQKGQQEIIRNQLEMLITEKGVLSNENTFLFQIDKSYDSTHRIKITDDNIEIVAGKASSLYQAFQTILQMAYQSDDLKLPTCTIEDFPAFEWRGMLLDCCRHFMDKDFVKRYIDLLALYKMNVLHWHLTEDQGWRIEIDKYPKLAEVGAWREEATGEIYGGFYSKDDIREVVEYAQLRGITVVPEIELPGHSTAALASYPHLSCTGGPFKVESEWGVFKDIYCAGNDSTFIFLEGVLDEVIDLFPSNYIHIGGDEAPVFRWENCEKCQKRMKDEDLKDEHELQGYFVGRIADYLSSKGKIIIGWDEILEGGLPKNAVVQSWRGFEGAKAAVKNNHRAIVSPTSHAYFDYGLNDIDLERVYSFDPVPEGIANEMKSMILGGECNMWTERAPQDKVDSKVFPRILAMSEILWSYPEKRDYKDFRKRVSDHYPILNQRGVKYGFEKIPVEVQTITDNGKLIAQLSSYDSTVDIFVQNDDSKFKIESAVPIKKDTDWLITFSKGGVQYPDTFHQSFSFHEAIGLQTELKNAFHRNYSAGGIHALTDGKKGSNHFRDGNWQGYTGKDVVATIDLITPKEINELSAGFLQYNNAWIFMPPEVRYEASIDGNEFIHLGSVSSEIAPKEKGQIKSQYTLIPETKEPFRYVRMHARNFGPCPDWHDAAGSESWLFIDEFSIK